MFSSVTLKFTETPEKIKIDTKGITIFVGPNSSGKSLVLRELEIQSQNHLKIGDLKILDDLEIEWPSPDDISNIEQSSKLNRPPGIPESHVFVGRFSPFGGFEGNSLDRRNLTSRCQVKSDKFWMLSQFMKYYMIKLDGRTRFELTNDKNQGDLSAATPANSLANIFSDDALRGSIRKIIYDAIGSYFVLDPTNGGMLRIRLSALPPAEDEQSLNASARNFHKSAVYIKDSSDGVQAYVGIVTAVYAGEFKSILIDEPEAFLHPPLARKLGFTLASAAATAGKCLLASTHSPDFLIGCLQASDSVRVVRLEYSNGKSKGRVVNSDVLSKMYKSPLMRSANVSSSLFYDGVVIAESDNDRAFYQEIYHRMLEFDKTIPSLLFINAQNKQTIKNIMGPLREFGMPAVAITDIDIIKDGGTVWSSWLKAAQIPEALNSSLSVQRDSIYKLFIDSAKDMKKDGGINCLSESNKKAAEHLFDTIADYGIFSVKIGELESWLKSLEIDGKKTDWTISALEKLGNDPSSSNYVKPSCDDVWGFMRSICNWISDPGRKGTS